MSLQTFQNSSTSIFIARMEKFMEDLLVAPLSYLHMVCAYVLASVFRGVLTGALCLLVGFFFCKSPIMHPAKLILALTMSSMVFACLGVICGVWADRWDHIAVVQNYGINTLSFLGGVFYSNENLPSQLKWINEINPIFYMVSSIRYAYLGISDEPYWKCMAISTLLSAILFAVCVEMFRRGYKLRS